MSTEVVHVKFTSMASEDVVYIGRANARYGLPASKWGNPFRIGGDGDREEVIGKYVDWLTRHPELLMVLQEELKGKRLACWCVPQPCHGHVLAKLAEHPFPLMTRCYCGCLGYEHDTRWEGGVFLGTRCVNPEHGGHKFSVAASEGL